MADGKLRLKPKIAPTKMGFKPKLTLGIKNPIINLSIKAEDKASYFFLFVSKFMGIIIKVEKSPKLKPQIRPSIVEYITSLHIN
jgi:hypothetical protein